MRTQLRTVTVVFLVFYKKTFIVQKYYMYCVN